MKYCKNCIMPDTRPDQIFDEDGVCNACKSFKKNQNINWKARDIQLKEIIADTKSNKSNWNCVIPSSGGKDSTYQAIWAREKGLNPVLVTATTCDLTKVGRENLENLKKIGFDTIEISSSSLVRTKLNKIGLELIGDISWPEHVSIFTAPIRFAINYKIPLILYGENPQIEYGGPNKSLDNYILDRKWLEEFGGLIGLRVSDLVEGHSFSKSELNIYEYPSDSELKNYPIKSIFLGYFEKWDSIRNYEVAKKNGFKEYSAGLEGCHFNFEKLDNYQHGIHDYFKFLKFGFARSTDQLSYLVRRGLIPRNEAIKIAEEKEGNFPRSYLGKTLEDILKKIGLTVDDFDIICDKFTNKKIFKCNQSGELIKDNHKNLKKISYDNI